METKNKYFYIDDNDKKVFLKTFSSSEIAKHFFKPKGEYSVEYGKEVERLVCECLYSKDYAQIIYYKEQLDYYESELEYYASTYDVDVCDLLLESLYELGIENEYDIEEIESSVIEYNIFENLINETEKKYNEDVLSICEKIHIYDDSVRFIPATRYKKYKDCLILAKPDLWDKIGKYVEFTLDIDDYKVLQCEIFSYVIEKDIYVVSPHKEILIKYDEVLINKVEEKINIFIDNLEKNNENEESESVEILEPYDNTGLLRDLFYSDSCSDSDFFD